MRQVAGRFRELQGLRQVPFGIALLVVFVAELLLPFSRDAARATPTGVLVSILAVIVVGFALAFVAFKFISAWYTRRFGTVEPTRHQRRFGALIGGGGALLFLVPNAIDQDMWLFTGHGLPLNVALFTMALWVFGYWLYIGRSSRHYIVLACIGIALGLASIAGIPPNTWPWHLREVTLYLAIATVVGGLLDHRILTTSLSGDPVGKES